MTYSSILLRMLSAPPPLLFSYEVLSRQYLIRRIEEGLVRLRIPLANFDSLPQGNPKQNSFRLATKIYHGDSYIEDCTLPTN